MTIQQLRIIIPIQVLLLFSLMLILGLSMQEDSTKHKNQQVLVNKCIVENKGIPSPKEVCNAKLVLGELNEK